MCYRSYIQHYVASYTRPCSQTALDRVLQFCIISSLFYLAIRLLVILNVYLEFILMLKKLIYSALVCNSFVPFFLVLIYNACIFSVCNLHHKMEGDRISKEVMALPCMSVCFSSVQYCNY